ncbi:MAG: class I SAM-dependent methyltransferase family protein [Candidatus Aenigmarchaeota archaeon]|nr:class I SAM-dependent methyltransferase family protein [Candidatus Aenigmarchaeota archaeon]
MSFKQKLADKTGLPLKALPSSYQRIGDIILIKLFGEAARQKKKISKAILEMFPYIKTVCSIKGISGEYREPVVELIAGDKSTITIHKEHGCLFKLDVRKIMFSKGNLSERRRLVGQVRPGETIVDMFAGIGYFSIGIAKNTKAKKIYAIEKNPVSFGYLKENIKLNKIKNIKPILGDCRDVKIKEKADRVIMGYFPGTERFLSTALSFLKDSGIIHYHNIYKENELWKNPLEELKKTADKNSYSIKVLKKKKVKSVAPHVYHIVIDCLCERKKL